MKYYCIANAIPLIKNSPSPNFFENLPIIGTPTYGRLPVTEAKIQEAFDQSERLILCKTLDDAMRLRQVKLDKRTNMRPDIFNKTANCPLFDYVLYEVEIDDKITINFGILTNSSKEVLADLVAYDIYFKVVHGGDRVDFLPDIEIFYGEKSELNPVLIKCHYFPYNGETENEIMRCAVF